MTERKEGRTKERKRKIKKEKKERKEGKAGKNTKEPQQFSDSAKIWKITHIFSKTV